MTYKWCMEKGIMLFMLSFFLFIPSAAAVTEENTDVKPNEYQQKDVEINTDYLHEESYYEEKTALPEEQKDLTFELPSKDPDAELKKELFTSSDIEDSNTIKVQTKQLGLTFDEKPAVKSAQSQTDETAKPSFLLPMIYTILILLGIAGIIFLIPRVTLQDNKKR